MEFIIYSAIIALWVVLMTFCYKCIKKNLLDIKDLKIGRDVVPENVGIENKDTVIERKKRK